MHSPARLASAIAALALLAVPGVAHAANINVTITADTVAAGGGCSLREAITAANDNASAGSGCTAGNDTNDTIVLAGGTPYTLDELNASPGGEDDNLTGDLDITASVTIQGATAATTVIDAGGIDRVFNVISNSSIVFMQNLSITGGHAPNGADGAAGADTVAGVDSLGDSGGDGAPGGGVLTEGDLTLTSVVVNDNFAGSGGAGGPGGIAGNGGIGQAGANSTGGVGGTGGNGGGVALTTGSEFHVSNSAFNFNFAGNGGNGGNGGVGGAGGNGAPGANGGNAPGGQAGFGGQGGGIYSEGSTVEFFSSRLNANEAGVSGTGGGGGAGGTGGIGSSGAGGNGGSSIGGSSVFGGFGGAIALEGSDLLMADSRVDENEAGRGGGGGNAGNGGPGGPGNTGGGAGGTRRAATPVRAAAAAP